MTALYVIGGIVREVPIDRGRVALAMAAEEGHLVVFNDAGEVLCQWAIPRSAGVVLCQWAIPRSDGTYVGELYLIDGV